MGLLWLLLGSAFGAPPVHHEMSGITEFEFIDDLETFHGTHGHSVDLLDTHPDDHPETLNVTFEAYGRRYHIGGLRFDRHFHPSYAELEVHPDGSLRPSDRQPLKRCYYEGIVQGTKESLVIFSSCRGGIHGWIRHEDISLEIKHLKSLDRHVIFDVHKATRDNPQVCGHSQLHLGHHHNDSTDLHHHDSTDHHHHRHHHGEHPHVHAHRRKASRDHSASNVHAAAKLLNVGSCSGGNTKSVDVAYVNDNSRVSSFGASAELDTALIVAYVHAIYFGSTAFGVSFTGAYGGPLQCRIQVRLSIQISWKSNPAIVTYTAASVDPAGYNGNAFIETLQNWVESVKGTIETNWGVKPDNYMVLTSENFYLNDGAVTGFAYELQYCGVKTAIGLVESGVTGSVGTGKFCSHELGHNLGGGHRTGSLCNFDPEPDFVMCQDGPGRSFSNEFRQNLQNYFDSTAYVDCMDADNGVNYYETPRCGDGHIDVEVGEQCDPGVYDISTDPCCQSDCTLAPGCTCAHSNACCNSGTIAPAGQVCRASKHTQCDTQEVCNGVSSVCPIDVHEYPGTTCTELTTLGVSDSGYCYLGDCYSPSGNCFLGDFKYGFLRRPGDTVCQRLDPADSGLMCRKLPEAFQAGIEASFIGSRCDNGKQCRFDGKCVDSNLLRQYRWASISCNPYVCIDDKGFTVSSSNCNVAMPTTLPHGCPIGPTPAPTTPMPTPPTPVPTPAPTTAQVTCKFTADNSIIGAYHNGVSLSVTGDLNNWASTNEMTFTAEAVSRIAFIVSDAEATTTGGCASGGFFLSCASDISQWDAVASGTSSFLAYGTPSNSEPFPGWNLTDADTSLFTTPCTAGTGASCFQCESGTVPLWASNGNKFAFFILQIQIAPTPAPTPAAGQLPTPFPTPMPTTPEPTPFPTTYPTPFPTSSPTADPTAFPTGAPTGFPTPMPTPYPTVAPTQNPVTNMPLVVGQTGNPTRSPQTPSPTTAYPSASPTKDPTPFPTLTPSASPTAHPSVNPSTISPSEFGTTIGPTAALVLSSIKCNLRLNSPFEEESEEKVESMRRTIETTLGIIKDAVEIYISPGSVIYNVIFKRTYNGKTPSEWANEFVSISPEKWSISSGRPVTSVSLIGPSSLSPTASPFVSNQRSGGEDNSNSAVIPAVSAVVGTLAAVAIGYGAFRFYQYRRDLRIQTTNKKIHEAVDPKIRSQIVVNASSPGCEAGVSNSGNVGFGSPSPGVGSPVVTVPPRYPGNQRGIGSAIKEMKKTKKMSHLTAQVIPTAPSRSHILPPGWTRHFDESGTPYYYNSNTRESRWDPPASASSSRLGGSSQGYQPASTLRSVSLPPGEDLDDV